MLKISLSILLITINSIGNIFHDIHNSVMQIQVNEKIKSLDITLNVFANDLEQGVNGYYHKAISIDDKNLNELIMQYINSRICLKQKSKNLNLEFYKLKSDNDMMIIQMKVKNCSSVNKVSIRNELLFEIFNDQRNIVNVLDGYQQINLIFDSTKPLQPVKF